MDTTDTMEAPEGPWPWQGRVVGMSGWLVRDRLLAALKACQTRDAEAVCQAAETTREDAEALLAAWTAAADAAVEDRPTALTVQTRNLWPGATDRAVTGFGLASGNVARFYMKAEGDGWLDEAHDLRGALAEAWGEPVLLSVWVRQDDGTRSGSDVPCIP